MEKLRVISHPREIGFAWRGGGELCRSLSASLLTIVDTIARSNDSLYSIASYRETKRREYAYGLSYNEIKKLKITKEHIYTLFKVSGMDDISDSTMPHISIEWCTFHPLDTIGWIDGTWFLTFPRTTTRNYCCTSSESCMQSL